MLAWPDPLITFPRQFSTSPFLYSGLFKTSKYDKIKFMGKKPFILKLSEHDEKRELEFELEYLRSLTFEERLTIMRRKSREMLKQMVNLGHRKPFEIIKRS